MMAKTDYIQQLQQVIYEEHKCESRHMRSICVREVLPGQTILQGVVEEFAIVGHPKARRCYAWCHRAGKEDKRLVAILKLSPVVSPGAAIRAVIASQAKARSESFKRLENAPPAAPALGPAPNA